MCSNNLYDNIAQFYDLRKEMQNYQDIEFYLDRAKKSKGTVLELSCGTGRVTVPLAEEGNDLWGIDLSESMLAVLEKKRKELPAETRKRLHFQIADMSDFHLGRRFSLIIIPVRSFIVLPTRKQQIDCLKCVREHLEPGGLFIPTAMWFPQMKESRPADPDAKEMPAGEMVDPETGRQIRRASIGRGVDVEKGIFSGEMVFYVEQPDGSERRFSDRLDQAIVTLQSMRDLLFSSGFEILEEMCDYTGEPIPEEPEKPVDLIFVCRHGNGAQ